MKKANSKPSKAEIDAIKASQPDRVVGNKVVVAEIVIQKPDGIVETWQKFDDDTEEDSTRE